MANLRNLRGPQRVRERGQALVEYGLILALIALVAMVGVTAMGNEVDGMYGVIQGIARAMEDALNG